MSSPLSPLNQKPACSPDSPSDVYAQSGRKNPALGSASLEGRHRTIKKPPREAQTYSGNSWNAIEMHHETAVSSDPSCSEKVETCFSSEEAGFQLNCSKSCQDTFPLSALQPCLVSEMALLVLPHFGKSWGSGPGREQDLPLQRVFSGVAGFRVLLSAWCPASSF